MSEADVHAVICPMEHRELLELRRRMAMAERKVCALRRLLRSYNGSLPNEYDGTAWAPIEDRE